ELLDLEAEAGKIEMIAGGQRGGVALFYGSELAAVAKADGKERLFDDHPGVEPMLLRDLRPRDAPGPSGLRDQAAEAVIGFERISAGGDEVEDFFEGLRLEAGVRRGGADFGEQLLLLKRCCDGHGEDMLCQNVKGAGPEHFRVEFAIADSIQGSARFQIFKPIAGNDDALARLVEPVVG